MPRKLVLCIYLYLGWSYGDYGERVVQTQQVVPHHKFVEDVHISHDYQSVFETHDYHIFSLKQKLAVSCTFYSRSGMALPFASSSPTHTQNLYGSDYFEKVMRFTLIYRRVRRVFELTVRFRRIYINIQITFVKKKILRQLIHTSWSSLNLVTFQLLTPHYTTAHFSAFSHSSLNITLD